MGVNAGNMDREIVVKTATKTQDATSGEEVIDWNLLDVQMFAQWLPAGSREAWQAQQRLESYVEGVYRMYDLSPRPTASGSRILGHDGRTYDVKPPVETPGARGEAIDVPVVARGD